MEEGRTAIEAQRRRDEIKRQQEEAARKKEKEQDRIVKEKIQRELAIARYVRQGKTEEEATELAAADAFNRHDLCQRWVLVAQDQMDLRDALLDLCVIRRKHLGKELVQLRARRRRLVGILHAPLQGRLQHRLAYFHAGAVGLGGD
jgi:hypothetical protein